MRTRGGCSQTIPYLLDPVPEHYCPRAQTLRETGSETRGGKGAKEPLYRLQKNKGQAVKVHVFGRGARYAFSVWRSSAQASAQAPGLDHGLDGAQMNV